MRPPLVCVDSVRFSDLHCSVLYRLSRDGVQSLRLPDHEVTLAGLAEVGARFLILSLCFPEFDLKDPEPPCMDEILSFLRAFVSETREGLPELRPVFNVDDPSWQTGSETIGFAFGLEGCLPLKGEVAWLDSLHAAGVRIIGIAHSFHDGHIVDPSRLEQESGETFPPPGPPSRLGEDSVLSRHGIALLERSIELGFAIDMAHLPEAAFWQVVSHNNGRAKLVASHANARALCDHPRNLTDAQMLAIKDSDGLVGICLHAPLLSESPAPRIESIVAHILHVHHLLGENHVALGTDLEGLIELPADIKSVADMSAIAATLRHSGLSASAVERIMWRNVLDALSPPTNTGGHERR